MTIATMDSVDGEWDLCPGFLHKVAVIPRERGEYNVYLDLPDKVAESGMWLTILKKAIDKLATANCAAGVVGIFQNHSRAFEFYNKVYDELTGYGY